MTNGSGVRTRTLSASGGLGRVAAAAVAVTAVLSASGAWAPATAAEPELRVDGPVTSRGGRIVVQGTGCDGQVEVLLYSGSGTTRVLVGYGDHVAGRVVVLSVPAWIPLAEDLTVEAACLAADRFVAFDYPSRPVELVADSGGPLPDVTGTLDRTTARRGQAISFTGSPCTIDSVPRDLLEAALIVFEGGEPAAPGQPVAVGYGPLDGSAIDARVVLLGGVEPGPHVVLPLCTNGEGWQAWPPMVVDVTANPAVDSLAVEGDAAGGVTISGQGCLVGDVEVSVAPLGAEAGVAGSDHDGGALDGAAVAVEPAPDGSWTYAWPAPMSPGTVVVIEASCGDPAVDGFAYEARSIQVEPAPTSSTSVTPAVRPDLAAEPAQAIPGSARYTG